MRPARTLWEFLDTADPLPTIVDTVDEEIEHNPFAAPPPNLGIRWRVAATAGVGVVLGLVVIAVGAYMFRAPPSELSVITAQASSAGAVVESAPGLSGPPIAHTVLVHVVGEVNAPGVVEVPIDSRVIDAISKAGGPTADAFLGGVNLARVVFDGEQIVVPGVSQELENAPIPRGGKISLSQADSLTLQSLPRVGPATAERIIAWRTTHGPFRSVDDLLAISGIGPATLEGFRDLVVP
jgi:competence protein ComEA